jgi:hypothetical protein
MKGPGFLGILTKAFSALLNRLIRAFTIIINLPRA